MKFGKAFLTGVLSAGVVFGVSSCIQSYTTGFLYVTGTVTAQPNGNGIISGYKIDHNTGELVQINALPVSSGGANPVRAVLTTGQRFLYVLNRGANAAGSGDCYGTDPSTACQGANITQFVVGGNGILTPQETFFSQGYNPFRLITDNTGNYLMVLDHDAPSGAACKAALGPSVTTCGDITVFQIDQTTGRLSLVQNAQVTAAGGQSLTYFPVPANPVDFTLSGNFVLTLSSNSVAAGYPYIGGAVVYPYGYGGAGQLTLSQNSTQPLGIAGGTAIINTNGSVYVLDNEPITVPSGGIYPPGNYFSQILPFTVGANGALQAQTGGIVPDDATASNPIQLLAENKHQYLYIANQGNNIQGNNPQSVIAGYQIFTSPAFQLQFVPGEPWGMGSGPQCIVEDPSNQYIYTANFYDSSITGRVLDPNSGQLNPMRVANIYPLQGPATWCLMDGRTS
ncbi:MAG: hypothetical protein ACLGSH_03920 [Acidobacteriota bacterium]